MNKISSRLILAGLLACAQLSAEASNIDDLSDLPLEQLLTINIIGASKYEQKQSEVAAAVNIITRNEINAFGWRTLDEALASLPGVYSTYDRQYSYLGTRGFSVPGDSSTRLLVLINGNRVNDPVYDSGTFGLEFPLNMDLIERIEFIPGPGGSVYGQNAMFGVVNVITRSGANVDGTELGAVIQSPQSRRKGRVNWGKLFGNGIDVLVSVSDMRSRGEDLFFNYPGAAISSGVAGGLDGSYQKTFFGRITRGPWSFEHVYSKFLKDDPTGAFFSDPLVSGQYQSESFALTQLQYQENFADNELHISGRLFLGKFQYQSQLSYGTFFAFPAQGDWHGAEISLLSTAVKDHKLMAGLEAQDNTRLEQNVLDLVTPANNIVMPGSGYRIGLYTQDEWHINPLLTSILGLRMDRNDTTGTKFSPRAALIWQVTPATTIKTLYGRAHRAPNTFERNYNDNVAQINNPALKGELINTMELVLDQVVGHDMALRGSLYQWSMEGLVSLEQDPVSGLSQYQNGRRVKAHGIEFSADQTWGWGARLRGSLSYQNTYYVSGERLANSPQLMGKLNFSSPVASTGLKQGFELQYYSERLAIDGTRIAGYWISNLNLVADKWAKGLEVSLGLYNLFDKRYQQPGADNNWQKVFTQDGRSVRVKAEYHF